MMSDCRVCFAKGERLLGPGGIFPLVFELRRSDEEGIDDDDDDNQN